MCFSQLYLTGSVLSRVLGQIRVSLVFGLSEIRQNIFVSPSRIAKRSPLIKIAFISSNVEHRIQYRRTAQDFSTCPTATVVLHGLAGGRLRLGSVNYIFWIIIW